MNAYELADGIESCTTDPLHKKSATMLRQQADRIAELEDKLSFYELKDLDTHPVKQLSDEEIYKIADKCRKLANPNVEFARAIIKEITE